MSNVDYLVPSLQIMMGDLTGTAYSESIYKAALVAGVRYLSRPLGNKYRVVNDDVVRNTEDFTFENATPYIENEDELGVLLAAIFILRMVPFTGSNAFVGSWKTPDLELSTVQGNKSNLALYQQAWAALQEYLKARLGRSQSSPLLNRTGLFPTFQEDIRSGNL